MELNISDTTLLEVRNLLEGNDVDGALRLIANLLPADQADLFDELSLEQQQELLPQLDTEDAADILEELEDESAAELAAGISAQDLAVIMDEMAPDEAADLLGDLDPSVSTAALAYMAVADDIRPLMLHPDETAGGLMTSEYLAFPSQMRASQVIESIRAWRPKGAESPYLFVVDAERRLVGAASLFDVLRSEQDIPLLGLMNPEVLTVHVADDQETAARMMARYDLVAVPVVDDLGHIVGVITVDDLVDVLELEATEDIQRIAGSVPLDTPYMDAGITRMAWKRLGWLLLLFVTGTLTGSVMRLFQSDLAEAVALTVFIPLLIGTGGNAGSQATATIIRALAVGDIVLRDSMHVLWRELRTSLILGGLLSVIAYGRAITWVDSSLTALVVSLSIFAIVIWANTVGALLPLLAAKFRVDPALVSGPLMSTLVDATGLLLYFTIARLVLGL